MKGNDIAAAEGFTLLEVLVVLGIVALLVFVVSGIPQAVRDRDSGCFDMTIESMEQIRNAILGNSGAHIEGEHRFSGYVTDMGELPELLGEYLQPAGLWTDRLDEYGRDNLPGWQYTGDESRIWMGWNGPYIEAPRSVLMDGWGHPLIFKDSTTHPSEVDEGSMVIKSLGANGTKCDTDTGYDEDIELVIRRAQYVGAVAGYAGRDVTNVKIYYPERGVEKFQDAAWDSDRYFRFEKGACGNDDIPFGIRSIVVAGGEQPDRKYIFSVEPTGNWIGTLE